MSIIGPYSEVRAKKLDQKLNKYKYIHMLIAEFSKAQEIGKDSFLHPPSSEIT